MAQNGIKTDQIGNKVSVAKQFVVNDENGTGLQDAAATIVQILGQIGPQYGSVSELLADLNWPEGAVAAVWSNDGGIYRKSGSVGSGSWQRIGDLGTLKAAYQLAKLYANAPRGFEVEAGLYSAFNWSEESRTFAGQSEGASQDSKEASLVSQTNATNTAILRDQVIAAADAIGPVKFFDTRALADDALGDLEEGQVVEVLADETRAGYRTRYRVESGAYAFKLVILPTGVQFDSVSALFADDQITYASGLVVAGDIVTVKRGGFAFQAQAEAAVAPAYNRITPGGMKYSALNDNGQWVSAQFDIPADGSDGASEMQNAIDHLNNRGGGTLKLLNGVFSWASTLQRYVGISIEGCNPIDRRGIDGAMTENEGTIIRALEGNSYEGGYMILSNTDQIGGQVSFRKYPNMATRIANLTFDALAIAGGANLDYFSASGFEYRSIRHRGAKTLVARNGVYADGTVIEYIHGSERADTTSYLLDLVGPGDGLFINRFASGMGFDSVKQSKGLRLQFCRGGVIMNQINGDTDLLYCEGIDVFGAHMEFGRISSQASSGSIRNSSFYRTADGDGQIVISGGDNASSAVMSVENNTFSPILVSGAPARAAETGDIVINAGGAAWLAGNTRSHTVSGALGRRASFAALIEIDGQGLDNDFNRFAWGLAGQRTFVSSAGVVLDHTLPRNNGGVFRGFGTTLLGNFENILFSGGDGTWSYDVDLIIDPVRALGRPSLNGEVSVEVPVAVTEEDRRLPVLQLSLSEYIRNGEICVKIYRRPPGSGPDEYDKYVYLHLLSAVRLIDDGATLAGHPWVSRPAGPKDPLNAAQIAGQCHLDGENIRISMSSVQVPTVGAWTAGDYLNWRSAASGATGQFFSKALSRLTSGEDWVENTDFTFERVWKPATGYAPSRRVPAPPVAPTSTGSVGDYIVYGGVAYHAVGVNLWDAGVLIAPTTTADLDNAASDVNTRNKGGVRMVLNMTTGKLLKATGGAATDTWVEINTETVAHTPVAP